MEKENLIKKLLGEIYEIYSHLFDAIYDGIFGWMKEIQISYDKK